MSDLHQAYIDLEHRKDAILKTLERVPIIGFENGERVVRLKDVIETIAKAELGFYR